jgi:betaine reductase
LKAVIILDQIQAGLGGKERADTPLGGKKIAMGSGDTTAKALAKVNGEVIGTFYCGTEYYQANQQLVQSKFTKMAKKMAADVVILGPTYDYPEFSRMACELAQAFQNETDIPVLQATAIEKNEELIAEFKDQLTIVKMPKKGDVGLSDSIENLVNGCKIAVEKGDLVTYKAEFCY